MIRKNRYIIIIVIILAIVAIGLIFSNTNSTFKRSSSNFAVDDTSNITTIFMSDKNNNTIRITRTLPGVKWMVNDKYPGHKFNIDMILETMLNLKVQEPVAMAARNNIIKELSVNSVKVEIYQWVYRIDLPGIRLFPHEKLTKVYYVGGATQNNLGTFMLMEGAPEPYITYLPGLRGFVSPRYMPIEKYWRDYSVFKKNIHEISSVRIEFPTATEHSFSIANKNDRTIELISLKENKKITDFDTLRIMNFLAAFRNLNFEALLNDMDRFKKDSILNSTPFSIITLTDTTGKSSAIKTFHKPAAVDQTDLNGNPLTFDLDRAYALVNDGRDFVLIQFYVFDKILKPVNYFIKEYKEESGN
jgi:hypothetical protein